MKNALRWLVARALFETALALQATLPRVAVGICRWIIRLTAQERLTANVIRLRAATLVKEAVVLSRLGNERESLNRSEEVIDKYRSSVDPEVRKSVAWAMVNKADSLIDLERSDEAVSVIELLNGLVNWEPPFVEPLAQGTHNLAVALDNLGRHAEAAQLIASLESALRFSEQPSLVSQRAWALVRQAGDLLKGSRPAEAIVKCDEVLDRWSASGDPTDRLQIAIASAIRVKVNSLTALGRYEEAIRTVDLMQARFGTSDAVGVQEEVAWAMVTKAEALGNLNQMAAAKQTLDWIITAFRQSREPDLQAAARAATEAASRLTD